MKNTVIKFKAASHIEYTLRHLEGDTYRVSWDDRPSADYSLDYVREHFRNGSWTVVDIVQEESESLTTDAEYVVNVGVTLEEIQQFIDDCPSLASVAVLSGNTYYVTCGEIEVDTNADNIREVMNALKVIDNAMNG